MPLEPLLPGLLDLLEQLAQALQTLAVRALEALAHELLERPAGILAVDQAVGQLVEELVRVDREPLRPVPARVGEPTQNHKRTSPAAGQRFRRFYPTALAPNPLVRPGTVEPGADRAREQLDRRRDLL